MHLDTVEFRRIGAIEIRVSHGPEPPEHVGEIDFRGPVGDEHVRAHRDGV